LKNISFNAKLFAIILIAIIFNSCKDPDDFGLEIQPQGDLLNLVFSDTTTILAYTIKDDSARTNYSIYTLVGSIKDPIFGSVQASFGTQFEPPSFNITFGDSPVVDSMVLILAYNGYYGDTSTSQTIKVYELTEMLPKDSIYSNYNPSFDNNTEIANLTHKPQPTTKIKIDTTYEPSQLRIKLYNTFAEKFLKADTTANTGDYSSVEKFQEFFKGFYITATPVSSDGAICYFDLKKTVNTKLISKLVLYYHNSSEDSLSQSFTVGRNCTKFNKFEHNNYQDAAQLLKDQIDGNKSLGDSLLYLQSMAGLSVKLGFPYLMNWYTSGKIVINRAELVITVEENGTYIDDYSAATKLALAGNDTANHYYFIIDDDTYSGGTFFGGSYNSTTKEYSFNITRQIQNFLSTNNPQNGLYLTISGKTVNATRVIIKGHKRSTGNLRLKLSYTKVN
jgi:hypothetical protein